MAGLWAASVVEGRAQPAGASGWMATAGFDGPRVSLSAAVSGNRLYVLGGLVSGGAGFRLYDDVQVATLGNDGTIVAGAWRRAGSLPSARSGLGAVLHAGRMYVVGGFSDRGTLGDVHVASLTAEGNVAAWSESANRLATPRSNHALQLWTTAAGVTYLAAIAGVGEVGADTVHFDDVEVSALQADGMPGPWRKCPFHLKGGRSAPATAVVNGRLFVLGGWGDLLEDVFGDVQRADIRDDGCLDPWRTNARALVFPLYGQTVATARRGDETTLWVVGGNAGEGNYVNVVQSAAVAADGEVGRFAPDRRPFETPRWGHASVQYGSFVYVLGGAGRGGLYLSDVQFLSLPAP